MSAVGLENQTVESIAADEIRIPVSRLVAAIWQRRRLFVTVSGIGLLLSICYVLWIPNMYQSTAQLMPPNKQTLSNVSAFDSLSPTASAATAMAAGSFLDTETPSGTIRGILLSRTALDDIINRFDLLRVYHCKYYAVARNVLSSNTTITKDKLSGIVSITVTDTDKYRARDLTQAFVEELDKRLIAVNASSAHLERIFLGERLKSLKDDLDATSVELSQFSSHNATLNPQSQGQALMEAAAKLQAELITAESELYELKAQYSDDNVRVRGARARVDELQDQLRKMGGMGEKTGGAALEADQLYPSIRELPILGVTYTNLYRRMTMQETIYETLTKQYELAKVEEAKEVPNVKVLDEPIVAETKSSPHRTVIVLLVTFFSGFAGIVWIVASALWEIVGDANPIRAMGLFILHSIRGKNDTSTAGL